MQRRAASRASLPAPLPPCRDNDAHAKDVEDVVLGEGSSGSGGTGGSGGNVMHDDYSWGRWKVDAPWKADAPWRGDSGKGDAKVAEKP